VIHYHGTPITPKRMLFEMSGRHFCVSFARPDDLEDCLRIGQSLMLDNGAFTAFTTGKMFDKAAYLAWVDQHLAAPHWAVVPDVKYSSRGSCTLSGAAGVNADALCCASR
jgi:hypothetical protein